MPPQHGASKSPSPPAVLLPAPQGTDSTDEIQVDLDDGGGSSNNRAIEIGDAGLADAEAALEAMQSFRLAEVALQRNDLANAQTLAEKAAAGDPTQSDYVTLLAWIRSLGSQQGSIEDGIATMTNVLGEDPSNERALLYRGRLYARINRVPEALADLSELLAGNPQHREAANEVRALKART
jgi:tetratricopeptide (TPR) repeat protein